MPFAGRKELEATAWFLGDRIEARALEHGPVLARSPLTLRAGERGVAVVFRYGAVVLFGLDAVEQDAFVRSLAPRVKGAFGEPEHEQAEIQIGPDREERVDAGGVVQLCTASLERLQVVAEVLGKSAVLSHYEERVAELLARIEPLAERLRSGGAQRIVARSVLRDIGDVLLAETAMAGRAQVIDKPEITWDSPELDRLYERLADEYELRERDVVLTRKLSLVSRTASTLIDLLQTRQSLHVEWYIAILIVVEIVLGIYELFVR